MISSNSPSPHRGKPVKMADMPTHASVVTAAAAPPSMPKVESLVKSVDGRGPPKKINETEATLRVLQRSEHGWEMANALLSSSDDYVRFFGALTFTVKLNADSLVAVFGSHFSIQC